jgi:segregation and condensation protein B
MALEQTIESLLYFQGEPMEVVDIAKITKQNEDAVRVSLTTLQENLTTRGIRLILTETSAELRTAPEASDIIEDLIKNEIHKDIGKAGLETLAIVIYRGPLSRRDIDYIRGVNSSYILRNLQIRGLVERQENKADSRSYLYTATPELLAHLGIQQASELPEFERVKTDIEKAEAGLKEEEVEEALDAMESPETTL